MKHTIFTAVTIIFLTGASPVVSDEGKTSAVPDQNHAENGHQEEPQQNAGHAHGADGHAGMQHSDWDSPAEAANRPNPVEATASSLESGEAAYRVNCVTCHGHGARGDGPIAESLTPAPPDLAMMAPMHPAGDLAWKIETGRGAMPGWQGVLSDTQIWDVVNYLKSLEGVAAANTHAETETSESHAHGKAIPDSKKPEPGAHEHGAPKPAMVKPASGQPHDHGKAATESGSVTEQVTQMADQLHVALSTGDSESVRALLAPDVLIFESGNVEASLEEYAGHHMPADMAFLASMQHELLSRQVTTGTDVAVVSSKSRLTGNYRDKDMDVASTETLVFHRRNGAWQIVHIHWSSSP